ncbi:MAG TPA: glycine oxidase ThiO [Thermoanaerobaculia bacterium]|jgi:glycine oxidase|nr:glycine oxidase ThiO [Thermoanaerobaculia bacterium]
MTRVAADTIVVGGGLIGCALAAELSARAQRVLVLERGEPGAEASSAAAGMLSPQSDARQRDPMFELGVQSLELYPEWTHRLAEETGVDPGYRRTGLLKCAFSDEERETLAAAYAWQGAAGLAVQLRSGDSLARDRDECSLSEEVRAAVYFEDEAAVSPRRLARAARLQAERRGAVVRGGVAARRFVLDRGRCVGVETDEGVLAAGTVVDAAGAWAAFDLGLPFPVPVRPVRGQIVALRTEGAPPRRVVCSEDAYVLPRPDGTVLVGSTLESAGFRKAVTAGAVARLIGAAVRLVPRLAEASPQDAWSGLRPGTPDGRPILGDSPVRGLFFATGHFRSGILLAPVTARLVADAILSVPESGSRLAAFSIERFAGRLSHP